MSEVYSAVKEFHEKFDGVVRTTPTVLTGTELELRKNLLREEFEELMEALDNGDDIAHIYKEMADLAYVLWGLDLHMGSRLDDVVGEVHASNMSKVWEDGSIRYREGDRKVLKPPTYKPADVESVLNG
jgi:predicted HAD superfamily Cof-like phosphohydrolase